MPACSVLSCPLIPGGCWWRWLSQPGWLRSLACPLPTPRLWRRLRSWPATARTCTPQTALSRPCATPPCPPRWPVPWCSCWYVWATGCRPVRNCCDWMPSRPGKALSPAPPRWRRPARKPSWPTASWRGKNNCSPANTSARPGWSAPRPRPRPPMPRCAPCRPRPVPPPHRRACTSCVRPTPASSANCRWPWATWPRPAARCCACTTRQRCASPPACRRPCNWPMRPRSGKSPACPAAAPAWR